MSATKTTTTIERVMGPGYARIFVRASSPNDPHVLEVTAIIDESAPRFARVAVLAALRDFLLGGTA